MAENPNEADERPLLAVTQADRKAAEQLFGNGGWGSEQFLSGKRDKTPKVQAFARHRLTAEQDGWQPFESYVRDCETEIDMWCQGIDGDGWNLRGILMIGTPDWVKRTDATDYWPHENGCVITHVRPLPTPPAIRLARSKEMDNG